MYSSIHPPKKRLVFHHPAAPESARRRVASPPASRPRTPLSPAAHGGSAVRRIPGRRPSPAGLRVGYGGGEKKVRNPIV